MKKINVSIVIPVYNEEKAVKDVIEKIKSTMSSCESEYEIIAVNDCSTDKSLEVLKSISGIKVLEHDPNRGYGASLKTGIKTSLYDWIVITDADGTYPVEMIPELIKHASVNDIVIGSREKKNNAIPGERKLAKKFLNWFASYLAERKIPDLNSGLRIFRKQIVFDYWNLFPERFSFTSTITMITSTKGYNVKFLPIDYFKREGKSSIKPTDFFSFMALVTKLSLFFKPIKVFTPISFFILLMAAIIPAAYLGGCTNKLHDTSFVILCATALQTFFFGLIAEIITHNK